ncbi:hypothetical protein M3Y97_01115600 [Aphelenchoides bicaudatus]|nr:hypothetical protein M3Y97_01115600 [Aphelenchoides bicaudatus]
MHMRRRSGSFPGGIGNPTGKLNHNLGVPSGSSSRHQSIVEAAEAHFDKNTIILCINLIILTVLMALLYVVATSAKTVSGM